MSLFKDLHQSGVLLNLDELQPLIHVVLFECLNTRHLLLVDLIDFYLVLLFQVRLGQLNDFLLLSATFLVESVKQFLVLKHLLEKLLAPSSSSDFLARAHLLLEALNRFGFLLRLYMDSGASVEVAIC
jgi:hypothetical protein